jgi:hypothetical protein
LGIGVAAQFGSSNAAAGVLCSFTEGHQPCEQPARRLALAVARGRIQIFPATCQRARQPAECFVRGEREHTLFVSVEQLGQRVLEREHLWQQSIRSGPAAQHCLGLLRAGHSGEAGGFAWVHPVVGEQWLKRIHLEDG